MLSMVNIGINAQLLTSEAGYRQAGIHQYISQLLQHIPQHENWSFSLYTQYEPEWANRPDMALIKSALPLEKRAARIGWEQIVWPLAAKQQKHDLLHSMAFVTPQFTSIPTMVTVYDLSFLHFPDSYPALQRHYLTSQTRRSCKNAVRVTAISESGRQDIHTFFDVPLDQIDVIFPAIDARYQPISKEAMADFRQKNQLPDNYLLHVGTLQPRKNIPVLLEAFAQLVETDKAIPADLKLVLIGGKGWLFDEIFENVEKLGLRDRVIFPGFIPDEELPYWYNGAELFVLPSIYEGFGIPVGEAMACGTPVVVSEASSIPEVAGNAGIYFNPHDPIAIKNSIASVLHNRTLADKMRLDGLHNIKKYSWDLSGTQMWQSYQKAISTIN